MTTPSDCTGPDARTRAAMRAKAERITGESIARATAHAREMRAGEGRERRQSNRHTDRGEAGFAETHADRSAAFAAEAEAFEAAIGRATMGDADRLDAYAQAAQALRDASDALQCRAEAFASEGMPEHARAFEAAAVKVDALQGF